MMKSVKSYLSIHAPKLGVTSAWCVIRVAAACLMLGVGLAGAQTAQWSSRTSQITALAENYNLSPAVAQGQSRIIFYRPVTAATTGAVSVLVNDQYHASLVAGGYTYICLNPGNAELGVRYMDVERRPNKDGLDAISAIDMRNGQTYYLRVNETQGKRMFLQPVPAASALQELSGTRMQVHTISRVIGAQTCRNLDTPQQAQPAPNPGYPYTQTIQLAGDTLFEFNRSDRAGLTNEGTFAIDKMMQQINREFSRVERVHVIGHADPLGNDQINDRLSIDRAITVREYMLSKAQLMAQVTTEGRGSRDLVVRHCSRITTPESMSCNQPNRRVTVEVAGQRRS